MECTESEAWSAFLEIGMDENNGVCVCVCGGDDDDKRQMLEKK